MTETAYGNAQDLLVELTADIVAAYVSNHVVPVTDLPGLISDVHTALSGTSAPASVAVNVEKQKPAVSVRKSVQDDHIVCLECGGSFKSLKRHLTTHHSMTPEEYREK
ncbi:MAG: MucR family transcriptional regulator Ros, partial [Rhizobium oryzihabitans]